MEHGNIIFLNGTSSSGKSTLAKELQEQLDDLYIHMSLDDVWPRLPEKMHRIEEWWKKVPLDRFVAGFHNAIAAYSRAGVGVIIDHCTNNAEGMQDCLELFKETRVVFVEVSCPLTTLREREEARGDRAVGQAEAQIPGYREFREAYPYDLRLDTSVHTPGECARRIVEVLNDTTRKTAFERMRERGAE